MQYFHDGFMIFQYTIMYFKREIDTLLQGISILAELSSRAGHKRYSDCPGFLIIKYWTWAWNTSTFSAHFQYQSVLLHFLIHACLDNGKYLHILLQIFFLEKFQF